LLAHFVIECILSVPSDERHRAVHIVSNDTLVESPIFQGFLDHDRLLARVTESVAALEIPVSVVKTSPMVEERFWVNLLGKGYLRPTAFVRMRQRTFISSGAEAVAIRRMGLPSPRPLTGFLIAVTGLSTTTVVGWSPPRNSTNRAMLRCYLSRALQHAYCCLQTRSFIPTERVCAGIESGTDFPGRHSPFSSTSISCDRVAPKAPS